MGHSRGPGKGCRVVKASCCTYCIYEILYTDEGVNQNIMLYTTITQISVAETNVSQVAMICYNNSTDSKKLIIFTIGLCFIVNLVQKSD